MSNIQSLSSLSLNALVDGASNIECCICYSLLLFCNKMTSRAVTVALLYLINSISIHACILQILAECG